MNPGEAQPAIDLEEARKRNAELIAVALESVPIFGRLLAALARQRRLSWLYWLLVLFVFGFVFPITYPLLAAFYLNHGVLPANVHDAYAEQVIEGFEVPPYVLQASRASNKVLDYFQVIEFIDAARETREYSISLVPMQRAKFVVERATLRSDDPRCSIPPQLLKKNAELMQLSLFDRKLLSIENTDRPSVYDLTEMSVQDWSDAKARMGDTDRATLRLTPVEALGALDCDGVKVDLRISVEVFKDLVGSK